MASASEWLAMAFLVGRAYGQGESESPAQVAAAQQTAVLNDDFMNYLLLICGALAGALIIWRVTLESVKYIRALTCMNNETQRYFLEPLKWFASFKQHLLYAPVLRRRHNNEFKLSAAINMGTLPTRLQSLFVILYLGTNVAFCVVSIQWNQPYTSVAREVRNRTGILAVVNMIPLFIMAGRNNPLINWLNISFDTFNLLHRWFGRIVILEALTHTIAWVVGTVHQSGWSGLLQKMTGNKMMLWGFIAIIALIVISIQAMSALRHAFYETFKYIHIAVVTLVIVGLWYHLQLAQSPQLKLLMGVIVLWLAERLFRLVRIVYRNVGKGGSRTIVEALPGNAVRVTMDLARPWTFKPGQHAYLYMPSIGLWTSHPFSVAWGENAEDLNEEKGLAFSQQDVLRMQKTRISFIIRGRTGFTSKLFTKASLAPEGRFVTSCYAEGPYGGMHMMHSYGTVMLFAGGVGISHQVPHVRDLVAGYANGTLAARKVILIWIIQSPEHLEWIRPWMTSILAMDRRREILRIMLFVSRPRSTKEIHSPSATVQMFPGRPNVNAIMDAEISSQIGAMGVSVCGPGALSDDVRRAVRDRQHLRNIDFVEEAFSW